MHMDSVINKVEGKPLGVSVCVGETKSGLNDDRNFAFPACFRPFRCDKRTLTT